MKNVLDRLESVVASTDATLSRKLSEASAPDTYYEDMVSRFIKSGGKGGDRYAVGLAKFLKEHESDVDINTDVKPNEEIAIFIPLQYGLELYVGLKFGLNEKPSVRCELYGSDGEDIIDDVANSVLVSLGDNAG